MAQQETEEIFWQTSGDKEFEGLIPAILAVNGDSLKTKREEMKSVMKAGTVQEMPMIKIRRNLRKRLQAGAEVTAEEFLELMKGLRCQDYGGQCGSLCSRRYLCEFTILCQDAGRIFTIQWFDRFYAG